MFVIYKEIGKAVRRSLPDHQAMRMAAMAIGDLQLVNAGSESAEIQQMLSIGIHPYLCGMYQAATEVDQTQVGQARSSPIGDGEAAVTGVGMDAPGGSGFFGYA